MLILSVGPKSGSPAYLKQDVVSDSTLRSPLRIIWHFQGWRRICSILFSGNIILDLFSHLILYHSHSFSVIPSWSLEAVQQPLTASFDTRVSWVLHSDHFMCETFIKCGALTDLHWPFWKWAQTCRTYLFCQWKSILILRYQQTYSMHFHVLDCIKNHSSRNLIWNSFYRQ